MDFPRASNIWGLIPVNCVKLVGIKIFKPAPGDLIITCGNRWWKTNSVNSFNSIPVGMRVVITYHILALDLMGDLALRFWRVTDLICQYCPGDGGQTLDTVHALEQLCCKLSDVSINIAQGWVMDKMCANQRMSIGDLFVIGLPRLRPYRATLNLLICSWQSLICTRSDWHPKRAMANLLTSYTLSLYLHIESTTKTCLTRVPFLWSIFSVKVS